MGECPLKPSIRGLQRSAALLAAILALGTALSCSTHAPDSAQASAPAPGSGIYPLGKLELTGAPRNVVATIGGRPAITLYEFNSRLPEFPVGDKGQAVLDARKEVVDQMVDAKLIVLEARRRRGDVDPHFGDPPLSIAEERSLATGVVMDSVANPAILSDSEARSYFLEHKEDFPQIDSADLSKPELVLSVKFSILSARFREKRRAWRIEEGVEI